MKKVCGGVGQIDKIVMFERGSVVHALVQYRDLEAAIEARASLHGCNIFRDSCTIKVEFAKQQDLNVKTNDTKTWDFTLDNNNITKVNGYSKVVQLIIHSQLHVISNNLSRRAERCCLVMRLLEDPLEDCPVSAGIMTTVRASISPM